MLANKLLGDDVVSKTDETIPDFLALSSLIISYIRRDL